MRDFASALESPQRYGVGAVQRAAKEPIPTAHQVHQILDLHQQGYKGKGVDLVVIDSGIDRDHPVFAGQKNIRLYQRQTKRGVLVSHVDHEGHGTQMAYLANRAAPEATLHIVPTFLSDGTSSEDEIFAALQFAARLKKKGRPMVICLAWGTLGMTRWFNLVYKGRVASWIDKHPDIVVVVSAGNEGPKPATILSPGHAEFAITVASEDLQGTVSETDDAIAGDSSRGARFVPWSIRNKPDISAAGVCVAVAVPGGRFTKANGTSQAAALVSGGIASILSRIVTESANGDNRMDDFIASPSFRNTLRVTARDRDHIPFIAEGAGSFRAWDAAVKLSALYRQFLR